MSASDDLEWAPRFGLDRFVTDMLDCHERAV